MYFQRVAGFVPQIPFAATLDVVDRGYLRSDEVAAHTGGMVALRDRVRRLAKMQAVETMARL